MLPGLKISLRINHSDKPPKMLSLRLKHEMKHEPAEFKTPHRLLVLTGRGGDFHSFRRLLIKHGVINTRLKWNFGNSHLLITGNCLDGSEQSVECCWLLYSLEEQALKEGGHIHFLLGETECTYFNDDWRHTHPPYATPRPAAKIPAAALYYGNTEIWHWLCTKNVMEKIGKTLFVQVVPSPEFISDPHSMAAINRQFIEWFTQGYANDENSILHLLMTHTEDMARYPHWYKDAQAAQALDALLHKFKVKKMVTAAAFAPPGIYFDGRLINLGIDHGVMVSRKYLYLIKETGVREKIQ